METERLAWKGCGGLLLILGVAGMLYFGNMFVKGVGKPGRRSPDDLASFSQALFECAKRNDVETIVARYCVNMEDSKQYIEELTKKLPGVEADVNPHATDELIAQSHREAFRIFRDSYQDLLQGEAASFSARQDQLGSNAVIIWVQHGGKYRGILIHSVIRTESGFKVNDWQGPIADPNKDPSSLRKKRAILEADTMKGCTFPRSGITYEYEFVN